MTQFRMFGGTVRSALVHAVTQYDVRQSRGKRYNPYAMGQYLMRVDDILEDIARGALPRAAIVAGMTGPLLACCLKAIGEAAPTRDELTGLGKYTYQRASEAQS